MNAVQIRDQLHEQIDKLPDEIVQQIADFALFVMARRDIAPHYEEWEDQQWNEFSLAQFFYEDDEVEYDIEDAQEIYKSEAFGIWASRPEANDSVAFAAELRQKTGKRRNTD